MASFDDFMHNYLQEGPLGDDPFGPGDLDNETLNRNIVERRIEERRESRAAEMHRSSMLSDVTGRSAQQHALVKAGLRDLTRATPGLENRPDFFVNRYSKTLSQIESIMSSGQVDNPTQLAARLRTLRQLETRATPHMVNMGNLSNAAASVPYMARTGGIRPADAPVESPYAVPGAGSPGAPLSAADRNIEMQRVRARVADPEAFRAFLGYAGRGDTNDPIRGTAQAGASGEVEFASRVLNRETGEVSNVATLPGHEVQNLRSITAGVLEGARTGNVPGETATQQVANIGHTLEKSIRGYLKERGAAITEEFRKGVDATEQRRTVSVMKGLKNTLVREVENAVSDELGVDRGQATSLRMGAMPATAEDVLSRSRGVGTSPAQAASIRNQLATFGTAAQFATRGGVIQVPGRPAVPAGPGGPGTPATPPYSLNVPAGGQGWGGGVTGGAGQAGGGRRGMWQGGFGQSLYTMYIARRFWQYTAAPVFQAMDQYQQLSAALAPLGPEGIEGMSGAALSPHQKSMAQFYLGQGAQEQFGGISQLFGNMLASPAGGRISAGARVGAGLLTSAYILKQGMPMFGIQSAAQNPAQAGMATGAARAGAGFFGAVLGVEAANAITNAGWPGTRPDEAGRPFGIEDIPRTIVRALAIPGLALETALTGESGRQSAEDFLNTDVGRWIQQGPYGGIGRQGTDVQGTAEEIALELNSTVENARKYIESAMTITGGRATDPATRNMASSIGRAAIERGESGASALISPATAYAGALGYAPGTSGFTAAFNNIYNEQDPQKRFDMSRGAARRSGFAGMFRQNVSSEQISQTSLIARMRSLGTQQQAGVGFAAQSMLSGIGMDRGLATEYGIAIGANFDQALAMPAISMGAEAGRYLGADTGLRTTIAGLSMTANQQDLAMGVMGGDLGAINYGINTGQFPSLGSLGMRDLSGNPLFMTDMQSFMQRGIMGAAGQGGTGGLPGLQDIYNQHFGQAGLAQGIALGTGASPQGSYRAALSGFGITGMPLDVLSGGGDMRDVRDTYRQTQFDRQMAGIGIGMERINLQRNFMWGGGAWTGTPSGDSIWGMQDQMRGLQWAAQQNMWQSSMARQDTSIGFARQGSALQQQGMDLRGGMRQWQFGFQRQGMDLQRQFRVEDYQYQDQVRGLQGAWQLEDLDEAIRMSSGRDRRTLVRQRERTVTSQNLEEEQIDRVRDRQEQLWAREDEQFNRRFDYAESQADLEQQAFDLGIQRRETLFTMDREDLQRRIQETTEMHELQTRIISKQRDFQAEQLKLSERALGVQAAAAREAHDYQTAMLLATDSMNDIEGAVSNIAKYDKSIWIMKTFASAVEDISNINTDRFLRVIRLLSVISRN